MKHRSLRQRTYSLLRGSRYGFILLGILALGYVAFVWFDAKTFQEEQNRLLVEQLKAPPPPVKKAGIVRPAVPVRGGAALGRIEIPGINMTAMIAEGIEFKTLLRAVGHIPGTAMPGQQGNVALAGHRDTFFRALRDIGVNDEIILTTPNGSTNYRVESTRVVNPVDISVLGPSDDAILTLVTCYPFELVGPAPRRFIVRARKAPDSSEIIP